MTQFPKMSRKKALTIAAACMMSFVPTFAQDGEEDLDLGALFDINMEVTVASKKAEKISDAPGMIVAYSDKDIKNMGYYTINDLANQTTGFSSYYVYGERVLESRGQKAGSFNNNKHLLLIDGIPVHNARNYKAPIEEEVPLLGAQRVELLKGPGSALYGTGAFYGVISVVPKKLQQNGSWSKGIVTVSSEDFSKRILASSVVKNDAGEFNLNVSAFDKEVSGTRVMAAELSDKEKNKFDGFEGGSIVDTTYRNNDDRNSQFLNMSYKLGKGSLEGLGLGVIYTRKSGGLGENWWKSSHPFNQILWETAIPYVKYQKEFSDKFSFNSYLKGNYSREQGQGAGFEYQSVVGDAEILLEGAWDFGKTGSLIAGVNYDLRQEQAKGITGGSHGIDLSNDYPVSYWDPSLLFHTISAYSQYQIELPVLSGLKLTAGIRNDNGISKEQSDAKTVATGAKLDREGNKFSRVSPRAGIVQKFSDKINAKVLYGSAIRTPGIKEVGLNSESKSSIKKLNATGEVKDVTAEVINTLESSVNLTLPQLNASLAGYYNVTNDALDGSNVTVKYGAKDTTLNIFKNSTDPIKGAGVELDVQAMPFKQLKILAGGSYGKTYSVKTEKDSTGKEVEKKYQQYGVPTGKINAAISYNHDKGYKFGITPAMRYYMGYRLLGDAELSDSDLKAKNQITKGYAVLDINVQLPVTENLAFEILTRNLTNTAFYQPGDSGFKNGKELHPQIKERSVGVSMVGQF